MSSPTASNITSVLKETRQFPPSAEFAAQAHIKSVAEYERLWQRAADDPRRLLGRAGRIAALVPASGTRCLIWNEPHAQWFVGGKLNACVQLPRPPSRRPAPQQGRHHLGRRAGR